MPTLGRRPAIGQITSTRDRVIVCVADNGRRSCNAALAFISSVFLNFIPFSPAAPPPTARARRDRLAALHAVRRGTVHFHFKRREEHGGTTSIASSGASARARGAPAPCMPHTSSACSFVRDVCLCIPATRASAAAAQHTRKLTCVQKHVVAVLCMCFALFAQSGWLQSVTLPV